MEGTGEAAGRPGDEQSSPQAAGAGEPTHAEHTITLDPQRLLRIASVTREVLEEARRIRPEPSAVEHLRAVHTQICRELEEALPPELFKELDELTPDLRSGTLEELALAHAEILGWLEGLFQGTQLALQMHAARALERQMGPQERLGPPGAGQDPPDPGDPRYL